jgi:hypothetical protein
VAQVRKGLLVILVIFVIYAVITSPSQSGNVTLNAWDHLKNGVSAIGTFFNTLLGR